MGSNPQVFQSNLADNIAKAIAEGMSQGRAMKVANLQNQYTSLSNDFEKNYAPLIMPIFMNDTLNDQEREAALQPYKNRYQQMLAAWSQSMGQPFDVSTIQQMTDDYFNRFKGLSSGSQPSTTPAPKIASEVPMSTEPQPKTSPAVDQNTVSLTLSEEGPQAPLPGKKLSFAPENLVQAASASMIKKLRTKGSNYDTYVIVDPETGKQLATNEFATPDAAMKGIEQLQNMTGQYAPQFGDVAGAKVGGPNYQKIINSAADSYYKSKGYIQDAKTKLWLVPTASEMLQNPQTPGIIAGGSRSFEAGGIQLPQPGGQRATIAEEQPEAVMQIPEDPTAQQMMMRELVKQGLEQGKYPNLQSAVVGVSSDMQAALASRALPAAGPSSPAGPGSFAPGYVAPGPQGYAPGAIDEKAPSSRLPQSLTIADVPSVREIAQKGTQALIRGLKTISAPVTTAIEQARQRVQLTQDLKDVVKLTSVLTKAPEYKAWNAENSKALKAWFTNASPEELAQAGMIDAAKFRDSRLERARLEKEFGAELDYKNRLLQYQKEKTSSSSTFAYAFEFASKVLALPQYKEALKSEKDIHNMLGRDELFKNAYNVMSVLMGGQARNVIKLGWPDFLAKDIDQLDPEMTAQIQRQLYDPIIKKGTPTGSVQSSQGSTAQATQAAMDMIRAARAKAGLGQ